MATDSKYVCPSLHGKLLPAPKEGASGVARLLTGLLFKANFRVTDLTANSRVSRLEMRDHYDQIPSVWYGVVEVW